MGCYVPGCDVTSFGDGVDASFMILGGEKLRDVGGCAATVGTTIYWIPRGTSDRKIKVGTAGFVGLEME